LNSRYPARMSHAADEQVEEEEKEEGLFSGCLLKMF
jgi:hypothetical protein